MSGHDAARAWADRLWRAVVAGDEAAAADTAFAALEAGLPAEDVLLDVVGAVQRRVGDAWAANRVTVADEHAATAINNRVISAVAAHPAAPRPGPPRGRITAACADGEWHALPARLLVEVLRLRGWRVDDLGAQVPVPHLVEHLLGTGPDAVALSTSLATRLPAAHEAVIACQATGVPVLVGGAAFGWDGRYARLFGADLWFPDARAAADRLDEGPLPRPASDHRATDDLPHLADREHLRMTRAAAGLVREAVETARTADGPPPPAERVATLLDFLAAALYTDDDDLFTGYLTWTTDVLTARGEDTAHLPDVVALLRRRLDDLPRARRILTRGAEALSGPRP
ncbi:B12-binding domain-containing protein [Streptomyces sp. RFCAC02]|uniref:cobalamin B12-binding domain-containing protein n=1 Tax=Streptomyces sp. RFCAC02 TaxID=2499143 RepID=UPI0010215C37|nr:B12-binding domain-containing protein [Streptomyces sp. RFCAC02]